MAENIAALQARLTAIETALLNWAGSGVVEVRVDGQTQRWDPELLMKEEDRLRRRLSAAEGGASETYVQFGRPDGSR